MDNPFTERFGRFACVGDTISACVDGFTLTATIHDDDFHDAPWRRDDGHGRVSDWRSKDSKRPGEYVLCEDHGKARFYDFAESVKIAKRDGWGLPASKIGSAALVTKGQIAHAAAQHDFRMLKAWCDDEWTYCGIAVTVTREDDEGETVKLTGEYDHALWGIELNYHGTCNEYLAEIANENADEALTAARAAWADMQPHPPAVVTPRHRKPWPPSLRGGAVRVRAALRALSLLAPTARLAGC